MIEKLDLKNITLVVQDWGGLLGLTLPMEMPERFERLLVMNTALAGGDQPLREGFLAWRAYVARNPDLPCGKLMSRACPHLTPRELAAYDAPFSGYALQGGRCVAFRSSWRSAPTTRAPTSRAKRGNGSATPGKARASWRSA